MAETKIEWADSVWNPVTGCTKVSEGCRNCYAERVWKRLSRHPRLTEYHRPFSEVRCHPGRLNQPLKLKRSRKIFVNSMSDLFHPRVPASFIIQVFETMEAASNHTFMVLTKRPERISSVLFGKEGGFYLGGGDYIENVWLGVSVEDQRTADSRIRELLKCRWMGLNFVSIEPMIGPVDLFSVPEIGKIGWVIVGGETGPRARPMHPDWVRSVRDQCRYLGIPFFFKQWGEYTWERNYLVHHGVVTSKSLVPVRVGRKAAGHHLDGKLFWEFPRVREEQYGRVGT